MVSPEAGYPEPLAQRHSRRGDDGCAIEYYTLQPAPTQWVAVGRAVTSADYVVGPRSLLVGTGRTEEAAVRDLRGRCPHGDPTVFAMVRMEAEEQFA